ncbi:hypothetical protein B0570_004481 [Salmonella enterica subsp. enterica serovar Benue]|nr:hypothetical protein [Salmonella enterica subsp. enterica serovar Benue]EHS0784510.1 hypothetical protein [Salmonella enterica]MIW33691.1 hypothetical protein [Salmonella enterica subsp. enterica serovar Derby]
MIYKDFLSKSVTDKDDKGEFIRGNQGFIKVRMETNEELLKRASIWIEETGIDESNIINVETIRISTHYDNEPVEKGFRLWIRDKN